MAIKGPNNQMRARVGWLTVLILVLGFGLVAARLLYMQTVHHDFYVQKATMLQTRDTLVTPNRGTIYDTNMQELARSASTERIVINPKGVIDEAKLDKGITAETQQQTLAEILSKYLELDTAEVLTKI